MFSLLKVSLQEAEFLEPEEISLTGDEKSQIVIKSNIRSAEVYLNGRFQGKTKLTVNGLVSGSYSLRVKKSGYQEKEFVIESKNGESHVFYVELSKVERK